jgi:hypothetical protein
MYSSAIIKLRLKINQAGDMAMTFKNCVKTGIVVNTYKGGFTLESGDGFYEVECKTQVETCKAVKVLGNTFKPGVIFDAEVEYLK